MVKSSQEQIAKAVEDFVNTQTWEEHKRIVETQRDKLLTEEADRILASRMEQHKEEANRILASGLKQYREGADYIYARLMEQFEDHASAIRILEDRRELLKHCRRVGIVVAFDSHLPSEEERHLLSELAQQRSPSQVPHQVELCQTALQLVNRNTQAQLWAVLQFTLANSSVSKSTGRVRRQPGAGHLPLPASPGGVYAASLS